MSVKQDVFHPLKNFFRSGVLVIFSPLQFLREFVFLKGTWQRALGFGLGYKVLTALAYGLAVQLLMWTPLMQAFLGVKLPQDEMLQLPIWGVLTHWINTPSVSLVAIPLLHIPSALFWAAVMWAVLLLSRCGTSFKTAFNFVHLFAPYALFYSLVFCIAMLFLNSLQTLFIMSGVVGILSLLSLFFMARTFHYGVQAVIHEKMAQDPKALWRVYVVLTLIFLIPCVAILLGAWLLRLFWLP